MRIKENIASAKQRALKITENEELSDNEPPRKKRKSVDDAQESSESETEEDSGQALRNK